MATHYERKTPDNTLSFRETIKQLPIGYRRLIRWYNDGDLRNYMTYPKTKRFTMADIEQLQCIIEPHHMIDVDTIIKRLHLGPHKLQEIITKLKLQPIKHDAYHVSPNHDMYSVEQFDTIVTTLFKHRQAQSTIKLIPNTKHFYDSKVDYSLRQAGETLNMHDSAASSFHQWINYHRIDGHYQIDKAGKVFLTEADLQWLKARYKQVPANVECSNNTLAKQLNISSSTIIRFREYYQIPCIKVLGYKEVFYKQADAQKLIDWYRHPDHRPYPYHI